MTYTIQTYAIHLNLVFQNEIFFTIKVILELIFIDKYDIIASEKNMLCKRKNMLSKKRYYLFAIIF